MPARGFQTMARRLGVPVILPDGASTLGLFDVATKAEHITGNDYAPALIGRPSVLLETVPGLQIDSPLTVNGGVYLVRDLVQDLDEAITRYFLRLP